MRAAGSSAQPGHCLRPLLPPGATSSSKASCAASSAIPSARPRSAGWAASASPAPSWSFPSAIQLPRLGRLRLKERGYLPISGVKILSATVTEQAGHWYVSVLVEQEQRRAGEYRAGRRGGPGCEDPGHPLGWDDDSQSHAICKRRLKKLKRLQRAVSRKQKGSQNRKKAAQQLATLCIARSPISGPTRCISSPPDWRKPSPSW